MSNAVDILDKLVSFPSLVGTANAPIVSYIKDFFISLGAKVTELPGPEGDRSNLFVSIGPAEQPGIILSGHTDVVPVEGQAWTSPAFSLKRDGNRLVGRGTTDMKGFLAAAMSVSAEVKSSELKRPLHLAFSYDEAGCRGVPHMIAAIPSLCALPSACIVGEPSGMAPILAHKGKAAIRISVQGVAGHSSRPELGLNSIHAISGLLSRAVAEAEKLKTEQINSLFSPPYSTLQVGAIKGGLALNVIPQHASFDAEVRAIPGVDPLLLFERILKGIPELERAGFGVEVTGLSNYPGMSLSENSDLARLMKSLSGRELVNAVSYGTEAGLFEKAGIPSIVCGPGDIDRAHKVDEHILDTELFECCATLRKVIASIT